MDPAREPLIGGGGLQRCGCACAAIPIHAVVEPPPRTWSGMQKLAIAAIVAIFLGCLCHLPPMHFFGHPKDPQRNWILIDGGSRNPTGKVEDLGRMDLGGYAIGAAEDCSKRLNDYISMDVLSAIQRAGAALSWVSKELYKKDACLLDFDVLLIEPGKLEKNLFGSIMWWANAINLANQRDQIRLAVTLAFNDKYMKLPSNWKRTDHNADIINFDGRKNVCSEDGHQHEQSGYGATWQQYLNQESEAILNA